MQRMLTRSAVYLTSITTFALVLGGCATAPPADKNPKESAAKPPVTAAPPAKPGQTNEAVVVAPAPVPPPPLEYVPAPVAMDPLRLGVKIDLTDLKAQADLWERVRRGFAMPDLNNDLVRTSEQWYAARPDYVARMIDRSSRYLFHIVEEVEKRGMPAELALLPFIESAFNPQAMSVAKAAGMWQFIPTTGKDFGLQQNVFRDDRRDIIASTRAALDYLEKLYELFGEWHLALAAYNWGEGNLQRAIARNQKAGLPTSFMDLRMPDETRNYVPKLQAVKNIVMQPASFALMLPPMRNHPYFLSVGIERDVDLELAAQLAGIPLAEFRTLNPQMNRPVILAAGTPQILLPYDNADRFVRAFAEHGEPYSTWTAWVAPQTMRPSEAAKRVGMSEATLRSVNSIPPKMLIKVGSTLLVPRNGAKHSDVSGHVADHATMTLAPDAPPPRRVTFRAGKQGVSVAAVAQRYKVTAAEVASWNKTTQLSNFKPGQLVTVYVPSHSSKTRAVGPNQEMRPCTQCGASAKKTSASVSRRPH